MSPTVGAHTITASFTGSPTSTGIAVYRVRGLAVSPLFHTRTLNTISVTDGEDILDWCGSEPGNLSFVGSSCSDAVTAAAVADDAVGAELYDIGWASTDGELWGSAVDTSNRVQPRMGIQHTGTDSRAYALAIASYNGIQSIRPRPGGTHLLDA